MAIALNLYLGETFNFITEPAPSEGWGLTENWSKKRSIHVVCEHFESNFPSKMGQKWTFLGFNAIVMGGQR